MNFNFIFLAFVFVITGFLGLWYFRTIPEREVLRKRLRRSIPISLTLTVIIAVTIWYVFSNYTGFSRAFRLAPLLYGLMLFEATFLLLLRWLKSNYLIAVLSIVLSAGVLFLHFQFDSFWTFNPIIITSFIGATSFLVRLRFIRSWMISALAVIFVFYDWYFVNNVYTRFTKPSVDPNPVFLFPVVTIGDISLGGGDFLFLLLFTYALYMRFGKEAAFANITFQGIGLLIAGYFVARTDAIVPFMFVMTPIFFTVFLFFKFKEKGKSLNE